MHLKNPFSEHTRNLYLYRWDCDKCGSNQRLELHHITGRDSNSPFNASLVCNNCHAHFNHNQDEERFLFGRNFRHLKKVQYKITKDDEEFMIKNKHLIEDNPHLEKCLKDN